MALTGFSRSLTWQNFRKVRARPAGVQEDAHIRANFRYTFATQQSGGASRITSANVSITVNGQQTWVVRGQESTALLGHEQGHYDITALGARELYNQLLSLSASSSSQLRAQASQHERQIQTQIDQKNQRYDSQTSHGTNAGSQRTWTSRIQAAKRNASGTLSDLP